MYRGCPRDVSTAGVLSLFLWDIVEAGRGCRSVLVKGVVSTVGVLSLFLWDIVEAGRGCRSVLVKGVAVVA